MEIDVKVKIASKLRPDRVRALMPLAAAGAALAAALRDRVFSKGKTAAGGEFGRFKASFQWWPASYDNVLGAPTTKDGRFQTPRAQYEQALHGDTAYRFNTSGQMADSIGVSLTGAERVVIGFRRSSTGYDEAGSGKRVTNVIKAMVAQSHTDAQIMEPSEAELQTLLDFMVAQGEQLMDGVTDRKVRVSRGAHGVPAMTRILQAHKTR